MNRILGLAAGDGFALRLDSEPKRRTKRDFMVSRGADESLQSPY
jgi:hypothetical protein